MSNAHWHLILNHLPVLGVPFGAVLLGLGLLRGTMALQRAGLAVLVLAGLAAGVAYLTGEPAEHAVGHEQGSAGIVLFFQADLWHPEDRAGGASFTAHTEFVNRLAELAAGFYGPVLLVSGDSHDLRVDAGVPWFSLFGATPQANVTQLVVDRSLEDDADFVRLHVDPKAPGVFSWENVTVPVTP